MWKRYTPALKGIGVVVYCDEVVVEVCDGCRSWKVVMRLWPPREGDL